MQNNRPGFSPLFLNMKPRPQSRCMKKIAKRPFSEGIKIAGRCASQGAKITRRRVSAGSKESRSNFFKLIVYSLVTKRHPHMLFWTDEAKKEFGILFFHKGNKKKWNKRVISLFEEADRLTPKFWDKKKHPKYDCDCRTRFIANLRKLCSNSKLLEPVVDPVKPTQDTKKKYITLRKYRIKDNAPSIIGWDPYLVKGNCLEHNTDAEDTYVDTYSDEYNSMVEGVRSESVQVSTDSAVLPYQTKKEKTHYLCLSSLEPSNSTFSSANSENVTSKQTDNPGVSTNQITLFKSVIGSNVTPIPGNTNSKEITCTLPESTYEPSLYGCEKIQATHTPMDIRAESTLNDIEPSLYVEDVKVYDQYYANDEFSYLPEEETSFNLALTFGLDLSQDNVLQGEDVLLSSASITNIGK